MVSRSDIIDNYTANPNLNSSGGAIYANNLTVDKSVIADNSTGGQGGGIGGLFVTVTDSIVRGNSAGVGGGINAATNLVVFDSAITGNSAGRGAGLSATESLSVYGSTISENRSTGVAGGIYAAGRYDGFVIIRNSTVSGNTALGPFGAGIDAHHLISVEFSTITDNVVNGSSSRGAGISVRGGGHLNVRSSIVAGNSTSSGDSPDLVVESITATNSLIGDAMGTPLTEASPVPDSSGNLIGGPIHGAVDPLLAPLANNGGPTQTHALGLLSPAHDRGKDDVAPNIPLSDQRGPGFPRE